MTAAVSLGCWRRNFYRHPSSRLCLVGVVGTNGKTTVTYLLESILMAAGCRCRRPGNRELSIQTKGYGASPYHTGIPGDAENSPGNGGRRRQPCRGGDFLSRRGSCGGSTTVILIWASLPICLRITWTTTRPWKITSPQKSDFFRRSFLQVRKTCSVPDGGQWG